MTDYTKFKFNCALKVGGIGLFLPSSFIVPKFGNRHSTAFKFYEGSYTEIEEIIDENTEG